MSHFARGLSVGIVAALIASSVIATTADLDPDMRRLPVEQVNGLM